MMSINEITNLMQEKLELKKQVLDNERKYIRMLAKYLYDTAVVWTYSFKEDVEITEDNLIDYVAFSVWSSDEYSKQDLLKAVRWLYNGKFNKR